MTAIGPEIRTPSGSIAIAIASPSEEPKSGRAGHTYVLPIRAAMFRIEVETAEATDAASPAAGEFWICAAVGLPAVGGGVGGGAPHCFGSAEQKPERFM